MRDIKFRCWVPIHKRFYYWGIGVDGAEFTGPPSGRMSARQLDPQQFTGFRDKNGHEIYEGDILRRPGYAEGLSDYIVGFERGHFTLQHTKTAYNQLGIWNIAGTTEVVGNVHENPELLTKEATQ